MPHTVTNVVSNAHCLEVANLSAAYPGSVFSGSAFCLRKISLKAKAGEITGLLGPNGCGKSTLVMALAGLLPLIGGQISWAGQSLNEFGAAQRARIMAVLPQKNSALPELCALELALMGRYPHTGFLGGYSKHDLALAKAALADTGCAHLANRKASTLSGGELQRVLLARALTQSTPMLLLDEPSSSLDPGQGAAIFAFLRLLARERGLCIISAMHDLNLAALYCDRLILLKDGAILAQGPTAEIFTAENLAALYETNFILVDHPSGAKQALLGQAS